MTYELSFTPVTSYNRSMISSSGYLSSSPEEKEIICQHKNLKYLEAHRSSHIIQNYYKACQRLNYIDRKTRGLF